MMIKNIISIIAMFMKQLPTFIKFFKDMSKTVNAKKIDKKVKKYKEEKNAKKRAKIVNDLFN